MQDYYAILGLDPTASSESIKAAYRRLARENHPDHNLSLSATDQGSRARLMAELNEAYAVLSDADQRRKYNENLRLVGVITATLTKTSAPVEAPASRQAVARTKTANDRVRVRPETDENFVDEVSQFLWEKILKVSNEFSWKETAIEGFDRGAEARSWSECYYLALRGFPSIDSATVKKFLNYASLAVTHHKRQIRTAHFAFLLPFQHAYEWESIANQCQSFAPVKPVDSQPPSNIVLVDMRRGQVRRFGTPFRSKRFEQLAQSIRVSA